MAGFWSAGLGASAISDSVIDSFEDGNISEYSGNTGKYSVSSTRAYDGSQSLYTSANFSQIVSTTGLDNYPAAGDEVWFFARIDGTADRSVGFFFGAQSEGRPQNGNDMYAVRIDGVNNDVRMVKFSGGSGTILDSSSGTIPRDTWLRGEILWDIDGNGEIQFEAFNDADDSQIGQTLTATDTDYTDGGIGWTQYGGTSVDTYFDYAIKSA